MNTNNDTPLFRRFMKAVAAAPWPLVSYTSFAVAVTIADLVLLPRALDILRERLVPYTDWVASMPYAFTIFFSFAFIYQQKGRMGNRSAITWLLLLQVALGAWHFAPTPGENFGNPYLTVSPWRPIWTILIPALWIAVLHLPSMNRFCNQAPDKLLAEDQPSTPTSKDAPR